LVRRGLFNVIDYEHVNWAFARFQLETELLLDSSEYRRAIRFGRRHLLWRPLKVQIEPAAEPGTIQHHARRGVGQGLQNLKHGHASRGDVSDPGSDGATWLLLIRVRTTGARCTVLGSAFSPSELWSKPCLASGEDQRKRSHHRRKLVCGSGSLNLGHDVEPI
jgi:hypothetical protein